MNTSTPAGQPPQERALQPPSPGADSRRRPAGNWRRTPGIFWLFFCTAALTLGGGLAMISVFTREFVDKRHWLSEEDMLDSTATSQSLPGIIGLNMSVLLGYRLAGYPGACAAVLGTVIPPFLAITILASLFLKYREHAVVMRLFRGIRGAIAAIITVAAWQMSAKICRNWLLGGLTAASFLLLFSDLLRPELLILGGAALGFVWWLRSRAKGTRETGGRP